MEINPSLFYEPLMPLKIIELVGAVIAFGLADVFVLALAMGRTGFTQPILDSLPFP